MGDVTVKDSSRAGPGGMSLMEIVRRRGVHRIAYFHCDHFEPWRAGGFTAEDNAADVLRFAECSAANEFSRRLTLFYNAQVGVARRQSVGVTAVTPDDVLGFRPRTAKQETLYGGAMRDLLDRVDHEVQVHIHHEGYTYNTSHEDPVIIELFQRPEVRARDAARFELGLSLSLDVIRRETGRALERWFFVHGQWALNASDPTVCHITNEIEILMRNGCLGDFTFPAGRSKVDPVLELPYFVRPFDAPHSYILNEAEPEIAFGNAAAARSKFFIWASEIRHRGCSLDYYAEHVSRALEDPVAFARKILEQSNVADGTLYFKTHSHSMHPSYWAAGGPGVFPHQHRGVRELMNSVFDAASAAGATVDFLTASEVYDEFIQPRAAPSEGFGLYAPSDRRPTLTAPGSG